MRFIKVRSLMALALVVPLAPRPSRAAAGGRGPALLIHPRPTGGVRRHRPPLRPQKTITLQNIGIAAVAVQAFTSPLPLAYKRFRRASSSCARSLPAILHRRCRHFRQRSTVADRLPPADRSTLAAYVIRSAPCGPGTYPALGGPDDARTGFLLLPTANTRSRIASTTRRRLIPWASQRIQAIDPVTGLARPPSPAARPLRRPP
jgi:hypothetical protein